MLQFIQYSQRIKKIFLEEYYIPEFNSVRAMIPHESIQWLRGIKGLSVDLRRHEADVKEALDIMLGTQCKPVFDAVFAADTSTYVVDAFIPLVSYANLSVKQFEKFYWPHLKYIIDKAVQTHKTLWLFCESTMFRFAKFFRDISRGTLVFGLELDDLIQVRKVLPNVCLSGGMTTDLLGKGTPEQCVDYAKKLVYELGEGFIISQSKMLSFKNDCRRENLLAVNTYITKCKEYEYV